MAVIEPTDDMRTAVAEHIDKAMRLGASATYSPHYWSRVLAAAVDDSVAAVLAIAERDRAEGDRLLRYALHLRQHGERAPGGDETWSRFDLDAEVYLRRRDGAL